MAEAMDSLAVAIVFLSLLGFGILRRYLHDQKGLRLREMVHQERMKAMEKDMTPPPLDPEIEDALVTSKVADGPAGGGSAKGVLWLRLMALCFGWFLLFGGVGMTFGFRYVEETDLSDIWSVGFIPAMAGIGLLLFYRLSADYSEKFARLEAREGAGTVS